MGKNITRKEILGAVESSRTAPIGDLNSRCVAAVGDAAARLRWEVVDRIAWEVAVRELIFQDLVSFLRTSGLPAGMVQAVKESLRDSWPIRFNDQLGQALLGWVLASWGEERTLKEMKVLQTQYMQSHAWPGGLKSSGRRKAKGRKGRKVK